MRSRHRPRPLGSLIAVSSHAIPIGGVPIEEERRGTITTIAMPLSSRRKATTWSAYRRRKQRLISSSRKHKGMALTKGKQYLRDPQLDASIFPVLQQFCRRGPFDSREQCPAFGKVDIATIVWIYQAKIPDLIALIEIRNAGNRDLKNNLSD